MVHAPSNVTRDDPIAYLERIKMRDNLIEQVRRGVVTPQQAEVSAAEHGLTLLPEPSPADCDPMSEPDWSMAMVLAWIMTRDTDAVREAWDDWLEQDKFWVPRRWEVQGEGRIYDGHSIEKNGPADLLHLVVKELHWRAKQVMQLEDARGQLSKKLRAGAIEATGLPLDGGHRLIIPAHEWRDLAPCSSPTGICVRTKRGRGLGYDDVALASAAVIKSWPAPICHLGLEARSIPATAGQETMAIKALASHLKANPNSTKAAAAEWCRKSGYRLGKRAFERVWPQAREVAGLE
jgi:hypothetical protein